MGTRSTQIIRTRKRAIRCWRHWDGYPNGVGADLILSLIFLLIRYTIEETAALFDNARLVSKRECPTKEERDYIEEKSQGKPIARLVDDDNKAFDGESTPLSEQLLEYGVVIESTSDDHEYVYYLDFSSGYFFESSVKGLESKMNLVSLIMKYRTLSEQPCSCSSCLLNSTTIAFIHREAQG